jgi:hypothetical protein
MIKLLSAAKEELQSYCDTYFLLENFIQRYKLMFVGHKLTSFVKRETNAKGATPKNVMSMLKFLIHKIVVEFGGNIFILSPFSIYVTYCPFGIFKMFVSLFWLTIPNTGLYICWFSLNICLIFFYIYTSKVEKYIERRCKISSFRNIYKLIFFLG